MLETRTKESCSQMIQRKRSFCLQWKVKEGKNLKQKQATMTLVFPLPVGPNQKNTKWSIWPE